jgi:hypothetical protein
MAKSLKIPQGVIRIRKSNNRPHNGQRFEDTTRVIRIRKSKDRPHNGQMFEDTTRVIRIRKSKDRPHNGQMFEDTTGVIRIRKSKNRPHNGQKKKDKQRYTKHIHKTKDRVTRTPLKTGGELRCSGRVSSSCSTSDTRRVILVTNPMISHE